MLPQLRRVQPMGQYDLRDHIAFGRDGGDPAVRGFLSEETSLPGLTAAALCRHSDRSSGLSKIKPVLALKREQRCDGVGSVVRSVLV